MYRVLSVAALAMMFTVGAIGTSTPASAHGKCKVLGFEVNDYGKEGPKRDALRLLDGYIKKWAKENNIKSYHRSGKKKVSCKLYIDVGFFDEWTCTAKQTVCH